MCAITHAKRDIIPQNYYFCVTLEIKVINICKGRIFQFKEESYMEKKELKISYTFNQHKMPIETLDFCV